jgi:hypothetical protein
MDWEIIQEYTGPISYTDPDNPDAVEQTLEGYLVVRFTYLDHTEDRQILPRFNSSNEYDEASTLDFIASVARNLKEKYDSGQRWAS